MLNSRTLQLRNVSLGIRKTTQSSRSFSTRYGTHQPPYTTTRLDRLHAQLRAIQTDSHMPERDKHRNATRIFAERECADAWTDLDNLMRETLGGRIPLDEGRPSFAEMNYSLGARIASTQWAGWKLTGLAPWGDVGVWPRLVRGLGVVWAALKFPVPMLRAVASDE